MRKIAIVILAMTMCTLSACGFNRSSNGPATPETQLNSQSNKIPNTGNEAVNKENDFGLPKTNGTINDPTFEKPS